MRLLAPHHDDVLLSLPALLLGRGGELEIVVCFSEESDQLSEICEALHRQVGVSVRVLGLTEAVRRGVSLRRCLRPLRQPHELEHEPLLDELTERLGALGSDRRPVVAPLLAVHLDHALTRAAAERACPDGVAYYEDQPYTMMHEELHARACAALRAQQVADGASPSAVSALLAELRELVGAKQIARLEASYAAARFVERIWFPRGPFTDPATATERNVQ